jgi:hypothetical protein
MAIQGAVIIRTPERGTSLQCLSSVPFPRQQPHLPPTQAFHPTESYNLQNVPSCNHRFVPAFLTCSKIRRRAAHTAIHGNPPAAPTAAPPGFNGRVRHCLEYENVILRGWNNEKLRTVNCRQHTYQPTANNPNPPTAPHAQLIAQLTIVVNMISLLTVCDAVLRRTLPSTNPTLLHFQTSPHPSFATGIMQQLVHSAESCQIISPTMVLVITGI